MGLKYPNSSIPLSEVNFCVIVKAAQNELTLLKLIKLSSGLDVKVIINGNVLVKESSVHFSTIRSISF